MEFKNSKQVLKSIYKKIFPDISHYLKRELSGYHSVLDLGCGSGSSIQYCNIPFSVGVDIFEPYLEESKKKEIHNQYIREDIRKIEFEPKSFDAVIALDVIEHLTKEEGNDLIAKMEKWAKKKVIIFTPNGFVQWAGCGDGNVSQEHKSGWQTEEFRNLGFRVCGINGLKYLWRELAIKYKPKFFWVRILDLTQKITYYYPEVAYHLLAIKKLKNSKK